MLSPDLLIRPSRRQQAVSLFLLVLSGVAVWCSPVTLALRASLALLLAACFGRFLWPVLTLQNINAIERIRFSDQSWLIQRVGKPSEWEAVELLDDSIVSASLVFLRFAAKDAAWHQGRLRVVVLDESSVGRDAFRRLKVFLRFAL